MFALIENSAQAMDFMRARLLRGLLSFSWTRDIFNDRATRLFFWFLAAGTIEFFLAIYFPLWVLVLGPMILGLPHLLASLRYVAATTTHLNKPQTSMIHLSFAVLIALGLTRYYLYKSEAPFHLWPEVIAIVITMLLLFRASKATLKFFTARSALILPFLALLIWQPILTATVLVLCHNVIGFFYWIQASKTSKERNVALFATLTFLTVSILIALGVFDFLYIYYPAHTYLAIAHMDMKSLGSSLAPWVYNPELWARLVVVYAFGQSMHYFVWLKAIPDQNTAAQVPTSFRQSWRFLKKDFGIKFIGLTLLFLMIASLPWALMNWSEARVLYLSIATYHVYYEIVGLAYFRRV